MAAIVIGISAKPWVPTETRESQRLLRSCDKGNGRDCALLAERYEEGDGMPRDIAVAATYYERGCSAGVRVACHNLGRRKSNGLGLPLDIAAAATLYDKGCRLGLAASCQNLGILHVDCRGLARDVAKAIELYQRACRLGLTEGCQEAQRNEGRPAPLPEDLHQHAAGCAGGNPGDCAVVGDLHQCGLAGLTRDPLQAAAYYRQGCRGGDPRACEKLGRFGYEPDSTLQPARHDPGGEPVR